MPLVLVLLAGRLCSELLVVLGISAVATYGVSKQLNPENDVVIS